MSEIKEGEYVRTKYGYIGKLLNYDENDIYFGDIESNFMIGGMPIEKEDIKAHSKNIIDLIEEGDYVNGHYVQEILRKKDNQLECMLDSDYELSTIIENADIKNIVTKEQFNSVMYKVVE